ncbi:MAG: hypothetical protein PHX20_08205, partial [Candidatus Omnitrophica bacterium]|nr:hypothetical protein [Candidatus Omnitrophota bacterium]
LLVIFVISFTGVPSAHPYSDDNSDRYSSSSSPVFAPGYLNAAKYQAEAILKQQTPKRSFLDTAIEYVLGKTSNEVGGAVQEKAANLPKLQKKQGSSNKAQAGAKGAALVSSAPSKINKGTGTDQRDANGVLVSESGNIMMSEIIDGVRHHYAGFTSDSNDTIQAAVNRALAGEIVAVRESSSDSLADAYAGFRIITGIRVYGGYDDNGNLSGHSNIYGGVLGAKKVDTIIIDGVNDAAHSVEVSGFNVTFLGYKGGTLINNLINVMLVRIMGAITITNSSYVNINNCNTDGLQGIFAKDSTFSVFNSDIIGSFAGINATNSYITAANNDIAGDSTGIGSAYSTFPGIIILFGGPKGNGIIGDNSQFILADNNITSYGQDIVLNNNSQASYSKPQSTPPASVAMTDTRTLGMEKPLYNSDVGKDTSSLSPYMGGYKANKLGDIFKGLLTNKDALQNGAAAIDPATLARMMRDAQDKDALSVPMGGIDPAEMQIASMLASIMKNPTDGQKIVLDVLASVMKDAEKIEKDAKSSAIKKATDELVQAAAAALLTQALPGLLEKGDIANIKNIFSELEAANRKILAEYEKASKPYYENILKDLSKNMAILQLKNVLSGNISKNELERLPPSELDKILEKIRARKDRAFEEDYILQQESKYRKVYLDPTRKRLEEDMKSMLTDFTGKINGALKSGEKK